MNIILLGYMGCGKTTIGIALAEKLSCIFTDLDQYIEVRESTTISQIIKQKGDIYFRKVEHKYLKELLSDNSSYVLSLGGGTPCYAGNMNLITNQSNLISFYLWASASTLYQRLSKNGLERPLIARLANRDLIEYIAKHLFERNVFYEKANHRIDVNFKNVDTVVTEIKSFLD